MSKQTTKTADARYDAALIGTLPTTSAKIRYLDSCGLKRGEISKVLGIRYQWVRNVLITPLKKAQ
jgi:hypothetical protein